METFVKDRILEKKIFFSIYKNKRIIIYSLFDIKHKMFAVVAIHFLYNDEKTLLDEYEILFSELLHAELTEPYLDWYENIELATQKNFEYFLE